MPRAALLEHIQGLWNIFVELFGALSNGEYQEYPGVVP